MKRRKANWTAHILLMNCLLKPVIEGKIKRTTRRGRRREQILDDSKGKRRYWSLDKEALDRAV